MTEVAVAAEEDMFLGQISAPSEQAMGYGRSAIWTLPLVATQYQPSQPTPVMQAALQAQQEARFLDAMILLDDARKSGKVSGEAEVELNLLRASFLLQGNQSQQALEALAPLQTNTQHAADAYALAAMAHLQQGQMQEALNAAQRGQSLGGGILSHLALSYSLQAMGRLAEARDVMHGFNTRTPQSAIALAREAELALTLDQIQSAETLMSQARQLDAAHSYVIAVSGLVYLIDGRTRDAKAAFESALKRDPKDAKALLGMGLAESKLGDLKAGQEKLQAANEADPNNALILTYLGRSQQQLGQTDAAMASWHRAQQADPKDPMPWLYQAQMELQTNHPMDARKSLRQAQERVAYRSVYRGDRLLKEDQQILQANLAEVQRQLGEESLAFQTLDNGVAEKSSATLRNQADVLQGQRFAESARRSLLLQSLFNERPGTLPSELDIYGDGAGQTGAQTPQHGAVSELGATQASYNNYDELFRPHTALAVDATAGNQKTSGEQVRAGAGGDTVGVGIAARHYRTDGSTPFSSLDNTIGQGIVQWRPTGSTQMFISHQRFRSDHGEILFPGDPGNMASPTMIIDNSQVTRVGLRYNLTDNSELRGLLSQQQTDQVYNYLDPVSGASIWTVFGSSNAHSGELQYRTDGTGYASQWGVQQARGRAIFSSGGDNSKLTQQIYAAWQQVLGSYWQLDAGLGWGKMENINNALGNKTYLTRWLPKMGVIFTPDRATHVRFAAWQGMAVTGVGDATLAPVSLAGVLMNRPGDDGRLVHGVALGGDTQLTPAWLLAGELQQHRTDDPSADIGREQILLRREVDESRLTLHWQPEDKPLAVNLAYGYEHIENAPLATIAELNSVQDQGLHSEQLDVFWFAGAQWTANLTLSRNQVSGTYETNFASTLTPYQDSFNQADAGLSWKFTQGGLMNIGVRNATDKRFQYTNADPLNPRFSNGRLVYAKIKLAW